MGNEKLNEKPSSPKTQQANNGNTENTNTPTAYVVVREGFRVSEAEYKTPTDPVAITERDFWAKVANNHSYGEPVEIVPYESKKHRVW